MALLSVIRRWHFWQDIPIREIGRRTGLSRNTIRKYLRIEAGKSRKLRRTARQMHADLVVLGYEGSYNRVAAFMRSWKADRHAIPKPAGAGHSCH